MAETADSPAPAEPTAPAEGKVATGKHRGGCLTAWLILGFIGSLVTFFTYLTGGGAVRTAYPNLPSLMLWVYALISLGSLAAVYGIWTWKKWGVSVTVGLSILGIILNGIFGLQLIGTIIGTAIGLGILYWLIKPVWPNFED